MASSVRIENVIICYPHLWEPHAPIGTTNAKYSAEFLLHPQRNAQCIARVEEAFRDVATEAGKGAMLAALRNPCQQGDEINARAATKGKSPRPELAGMRVIRASDANNPPTVVDQALRLLGKDQAANVFGGCIVNAFLRLYWSNNLTNPGVFVGLNGVQLVSNVGVTRLGGGALAPEQMFKAITDSVEEEPWLL
jgi:hypothetical protein